MSLSTNTFEPIHQAQARLGHHDAGLDERHGGFKEIILSTTAGCVAVGVVMLCFIALALM